MLEIGYNKRLEMQLNFIIEIDKIKNIFRKLNYLTEIVLKMMQNIHGQYVLWHYY